MKHIAIFPGAFKPPTKGHFQAVVDLANNKFKVANYDVEEVPAVGNKTKKVAANITGKAPDFKIDEVLVLYGTQERNGITAEISAAIWNIYKKHLPANVKIAPANGNPAEIAKDIIVANPDNQYYIPVGLRRPEDLKDLGRLNLYKNLPNAKGVAVYDVPEEGQDLMSATFLRNALLAGNDDEAKKYLPSELTAKELSQVIDTIKSTLTIEERMNYAMEQVMLGMLTEEKEVEEVTMGLPVAPIAVLPSEVTQYMRDLAEKIKAVLPEDVLLVYNGQAITITPKYYNKPNAEDNTPNQDPITEYQDHAAAINYVPYIAGILEHMIKKGMTVLPLPEIKTREDEENAANVFGRTAYYDPTKKEVVLYITGRHPKDVLRSFCHEMIHHMQNLEGRLPAFTTTNTQEDSTLNDIEKEAHFLGSMLMREYEDSIKKEDSPVNENALANIIAKIAAPLVNYIISTAIDGLFGYIDDIKNIVAPEPYIKFLKGLEKNDEFNKQFIALVIQRDKEKNAPVGNEWRELTTNLPAFREAFDKFAEEQGIEGMNKSNLLFKISKTMWDTYLRTWKDIHQVLKKKYPDLTQDLREGTKYRSIVADVRQAVNIALNALLSGKKLKGYNVETKREPSKADAKLAAQYGMSALGIMLNTEKQEAYLGQFTSKSEKGTPTSVEVTLKFALSDQVKQGTYFIDGSADSDEGSLEVMLAFNPADGTNMLQQIQPTLTDLIRHETEHLTQSGDQVKPDKWMRGDEARRKAIRQDPEKWYKYYMLPKEVDANIQGLYTKSKYEKKDFQSTVDQYLEDLVQGGIITVGNKQKIYDLWKSRIPQIGGIPNLK